MNEHGRWSWAHLWYLSSRCSSNWAPWYLALCLRIPPADQVTTWWSTRNSNNCLSPAIAGLRAATGCCRKLSNARPAKTSTYINHAFHNMVIDHRSLHKFVLLHQIPSLHPSFGANPYRMDFGRLSVATVISVCHRISIKLVQTTNPGSSRATKLPTRSIQYLYAQKARFAHTTFEGLQRILTQGNLKDGLKEFLGNHQIPPQFNFICKGIFKEFRGYALGLMRLLMMMMTTIYNKI